MFKDSAKQSFVNEEEMKGFLKERESTVIWKRVDVNEIQYAGIETAPLLFTKAAKFLNLDTDIALDTLSDNGSKMFALCDGETYAVRSSAISSIMDRAKVYGKSLQKLPREQLSDILNMCSKVAGGKALIRISDGKISAVLGGDETEYSIIPAVDVMEEVSTYLAKTYPEAKFMGGYWDHNYTRIEWTLKEYAEEFAEAISENPENITPSLVLTTSDTGMSAVTLQPRLNIRGLHVPLNVELKTEHKNKRTILDVIESTHMIYAYFHKSVNELSKLNDILIENGKNCMLRIMKKCAIPKKAALHAAEAFEMMYGSREVTAREVYFSICETLMYDDSYLEADSRKRFKMEDNVAKCMAVNWKSYDLPGTFSW